MLLWLLETFPVLLELVSSRTTGDSRVFLSARIAGAGVCAFGGSVLVGPTVIGWLKKRFRERIASASGTLNQLHASKQDTPTMGGLFVMGVVLLCTLVWTNLTSEYVRTAVLLVTTMTAVGAADDWIKQRSRRNGLTARQKLGLQILLATVTSWMLYTCHLQHEPGAAIVWPLGNRVLTIGLFYIAWSALVIVGAANAVNLTDGLDGLAAGCTIVAAVAYTVLLYLCGHAQQSAYLSIPHVAGSGEIAVVLGSLAGAMCGFLWFNCHPAQVFLGDAGSLPTGALLAFAALVCRQELLLTVIGGIFVVETGSVIMQVLWFRTTGRRILRCSPLHNHFVFRGDPETRIVTRFWIISAILAVIGLATLKLR
ncbi:MAG: phospho-N-acetylmuramoyl-pentapeptide-transferase [Planctomycetaceae bacterium]